MRAEEATGKERRSSGGSGGAVAVDVDEGERQQHERVQHCAE
jgi:hypothetical protein